MCGLYDCLYGLCGILFGLYAQIRCDTGQGSIVRAES